MRIGLIAALQSADDGVLRAQLPLAGRSVLAWQAELLQSLGVDRVLCLTEVATNDILQLQHKLEARGTAFHVLQGMAALPALVRAEDDLIIVCDGLVPDRAAVHALFGGGEALDRVVGTIPADHAFAIAHPHDFERIDATRNWAGVLVMRGAAVQQLGDFAGDADAVSLLLRLALQAGTPCRELAQGMLVPESWLLADSALMVAEAERALIANAAILTDWRAPLATLAAWLVREFLPRGFSLGATIAGVAALVLLLSAVVTVVFIPIQAAAAIGLGLAGLGAFAAQIAASYAAFDAKLRFALPGQDGLRVLASALDALTALTLWFALSPWPGWQPLAVVGPVVIGLARVVSQHSTGALAAVAGERAGLLLILTVAASFGFLPEALGCLALGLLAALLLRGRAT